MPLDGRVFHLFKPNKGLTYYPNFISMEEKGEEIYYRIEKNSIAINVYKM